MKLRVSSGSSPGFLEFLGLDEGNIPFGLEIRPIQFSKRF